VERVEEINHNDGYNPQNVTEERLCAFRLTLPSKVRLDDISSTAGLQEQISISKKYETRRYNFQKQFLCVF
jgi:hypothetical protein